MNAYELTCIFATATNLLCSLSGVKRRWNTRSVHFAGKTVVGRWCSVCWQWSLQCDILFANTVLKGKNPTKNKQQKLPKTQTPTSPEKQNTPPPNPNSHLHLGLAPLHFSASACHLPAVHMILTVEGWITIAVKCLEFAAVLSRNEPHSSHQALAWYFNHTFNRK